MNFTINYFTSYFSPISALVFVILLWCQWKTTSGGAIWMILFRLPSTACHELAHMLIALITCSRITGFSLIPRKTNDVWVLGSVSCSNLGVWSAFPVAMAPILNLIPALYLLSAQEQGGMLYICTSFIFITGAIPSITDFKVAARHPMSVLVWVVTVAVIWAGVKE